MLRISTIILYHREQRILQKKINNHEHTDFYTGSPSYGTIQARLHMGLCSATGVVIIYYDNQEVYMRNHHQVYKRNHTLSKLSMFISLTSISNDGVPIYKEQ